MWYDDNVQWDSSKFCDEVFLFGKNVTQSWDVPFIFNQSNIYDHPLKQYTVDMLNYVLTRPNIYVAAEFGDAQPRPDYPIIAKTRLVNSSTMVALLNQIRHYSEETFHFVHYDDIPWHEKKDVLVWRGASTGNRFDVVSQYFNMTHDGIDVAFTILAKEWQNNSAQFQRLVGNSMTTREILKYKYLLSLEGNDVATGLKWMLLSNSVVLMAPPRFESWAMEGRLIPYYHFIPLKPDHSDLREKLEWVRNNEILCQRIAKQATDYMKSLYTSSQAKKETNTIMEKLSSRYQTLYGDAVSQCQRARVTN